jgi:DNA-binding NtrC family response regulator
MEEGVRPTHITRVVTRNDILLRVAKTCTIEVVGPGGAKRSVQVDQPMFRIGSHALNHLVLADESVSKHHLELSLCDDGYRIVDLDSSNGTYWGSVRIGEITIVEPVTLLLGQTRIVISPTQQEVEIPASATHRFGSVLGRSVVMRELFGQLEKIARGDASVLIEGESGVGKELVAESLHERSARANGPFVVVDCAAIAATLFESELFGHRKGAFTGADADREGLLSLAHGGTVFLDEIGELSPPLQVKLLGAIERREFKPVGSSKARSFDARVIAATRCNLAREVNRNRFRSDLFYRLAVIRVRVPPLRERIEDIPLLVTRFLKEMRETQGSGIPTELSAITLTRLAAQPWPGNVRELRNAVERAILQVQAPGEAAEGEPYAVARSRALADFDQRYLRALLEHADFNVSEAARRAALDRRNFQRLLRRYGIQPGKLKPAK